MQSADHEPDEISVPLTMLWLGIAGAAHFVLMPPYAQHGWFVLHPVIWIMPIAIFSRLTAKRAFGWGLVLGTIANLFIYEWLVETLRRYTEIPIFGIYAIVLLYSLAAGLVIAAFASGIPPLRRLSGSAWPFAVAAWLVTCEHWTPQFFPYAQGQAAQLGVPIVRTATTGISAFIDARGQVTRRGGRFTEEVLVDEVRPLRATGLYATIGPWFAWLCSAVCGGLLLRKRFAAARPRSN